MEKTTDKIFNRHLKNISCVQGNETMTILFNICSNYIKHISYLLLPLFLVYSLIDQDYQVGLCLKTLRIYSFVLIVIESFLKLPTLFASEGAILKSKSKSKNKNWSFKVISNIIRSWTNILNLYPRSI